ncbi:hypothetical protein PG994_005176 [Apiospora phragmitis]|uniref:Uncharacterized protein n=1 Tax=Apiospora phragmitis TaxID=2905665 RepID=A0ABR1VSY7_9PEZI
MASGPSNAPSGGESADDQSESRSAYNDLRRLIPSLASELDQLRAALREHNLWLQRYGHMSRTPADPYGPPPPSSSSSADQPQQPQNQQGATSAADPELPAYSASDVPPYTGGPNSVTAYGSTSTREEVQQRRDQLTEWLAEGEDVLREYSARFAQLAETLQILPPEDLLGTWNEASPDNALPDYAQVETREELMVGGVGEVPPPYVRGQVMAKIDRR